MNLNDTIVLSFDNPSGAPLALNMAAVGNASRELEGLIRRIVEIIADDYFLESLPLVAVRSGSIEFDFSMRLSYRSDPHSVQAITKESRRKDALTASAEICAVLSLFLALSSSSLQGSAPPTAIYPQNRLGADIKHVLTDEISIKCRDNLERSLARVCAENVKMYMPESGWISLFGDSGLPSTRPSSLILRNLNKSEDNSISRGRLSDFRRVQQPNSVAGAPDLWLAELRDIRGRGHSLVLLVWTKGPKDFDLHRTFEAEFRILDPSTVLVSSNMKDPKLGSEGEIDAIIEVIKWGKLHR